MARKRTASLPMSRRTEMIRIVTERGSASVPELADLFRVSTDTIRRDLDALHDSGKLVRAHGGAVWMPGGDRITPVTDRIGAESDGKKRIAAAASGLIADGEALIVNGGSTTLAFIKALSGHRSLNLVTNSVPVLDQLNPAAFSNVYAVGGEYQPATKVMLGPPALSAHGRVNVDTAVIGVRAITAEAGISTAFIMEAEVILAMTRLARRTIVLADARKFEQSAFATIAPLGEIDVLVTNAPPPPALASALELSGVETIIAP